MPDKLPKLDFIESHGTRWPVDALRYLTTLSAADLKTEIKRLIGDTEPTTEPKGA
jgi:hypothetical protein